MSAAVFMAFLVVIPSFKNIKSLVSYLFRFIAILVIHFTSGIILPALKTLVSSATAPRHGLGWLIGARTACLCWQSHLLGWEDYR